jgi:fatty-acyl-CoA synthase
VSRPVHRTELSPVSFLDRSARVFSDTTAVVHGTRRYSYAELDTRCRRLASALGSAGLASGDRVALLSPNTPAMLEAHFGVPLAGGVLVPINVRLQAPEIGYILGHSGARFLLVDAALTGSLEGLDLTGLRMVRVDDTGAPGDPYEDLLASGDPSGPSRGAPEDEDALISINYTSGTTGRPKGVMCTHRGAHLNALGDVLDNGLTAGTVYLWTLPMFHGNGWCFTWAVTAVGGTHVCLRAPDPARIWELLEVEGVTHMCSAPTVQIGVAHHAAARPLTHTVTKFNLHIG